MFSTANIITAVLGLLAPFAIGLYAYLKGKKRGQLQGSFEAGVDEVKRHNHRIKATQVIEQQAAEDIEALDDLRVEDTQLPTEEDLTKLHGVVEALRFKDGSHD